MLDALLATTDPGDEVILTDPTYAGMINRVRLAGGGAATRAVLGGRRRAGGSTSTRWSGAVPAAPARSSS